MENEELKRITHKCNYCPVECVIKTANGTQTPTKCPYDKTDAPWEKDTRPTPSLDGVGGIINVMGSSDRLKCCDWKYSDKYRLAKALLPYLKDKVEWDVTKLAISLFQYRRSDKRLEWHMLTDVAQEPYINEAKALTQTLKPPVDKRVDWDEEAVAEFLTRHPAITASSNVEKKSRMYNKLSKDLTQRFQPPTRIWPEEIKKVLREKFSNMLDRGYAGAEFTIELSSKLDDCVEALCKAAHPVKEIEWPEELKQTRARSLNGRVNGANEMLAKCKEAERKRYE